MTLTLAPDIWTVSYSALRPNRASGLLAQLSREKDAQKWLLSHAGALGCHLKSTLEKALALLLQLCLLGSSQLALVSALARQHMGSSYSPSPCPAVRGVATYSLKGTSR